MSITEGWYATLLHWSSRENRLAHDGVATISQCYVYNSLSKLSQGIEIAIRKVKTNFTKSQNIIDYISCSFDVLVCYADFL